MEQSDVKAMISALMEEFPMDAMQQVQMGGKFFDYVKAHYVIKRLIDVFGLEWSAETIGNPIFNEDPTTGSLWITMGVRLSTRINGYSWCQDGWDSVEVKKFSSGYKKGGWVDLGNNIKQSYSQALKKAATNLGVALYLYFEKGLSDDAGYDEPAGDPFETPAETPAVARPETKKPLGNPPPRPAWGNELEEQTNGTSTQRNPNLDINAFFNVPTSAKKNVGHGLRKSSPEVQVEASLEVLPSLPPPPTTNEETGSSKRPSLLQVNAVKLGIRDGIAKGLIPADKSMEEIIEELTGIPNINDLSSLDKETIRELIYTLKELRGEG